MLKLPIDFAKKIGEVLVISEQGVDQLFEVEEDKAGFFVAKLKPRQFLEKEQFKTMCALVRDLGGEGYLQGAKAWRIPGPFVKKSSEVPSGQETDFLATHKAPGAVPRVLSGVAPDSVALDKSKPLFSMLPVKGLLSMPFQCREGIGEGAKFAELVESIRTLGVLQPIVVRQKASGSFEIVAGERRVAACKRLGIAGIPANVKV
ncbi:ParB N-terminal domain-containing protein, partial [Candidatus Bathyarchaeota archaeon]|nr:ParB N-terminal domain-containing protein [Candidatus Bathyarchaeota archaeon]